MPSVPDAAGQPVTPAQRDAAIAALVVHREAGRLSSTEFENRQVLADSAQVWADLDRLFVDLPAPHPQRPQPPDQPQPVYPAPAGSGGARGIDWGTRLVAAMPILAVILFFVTKQWLVFLLIPLVAILAKGPRGR
jgi:hypothetical protein